MERREYLGGVLKTELNGAINNVTTTIVVNDGSSFPTGAEFPFIIVIDRGTIDEEKILCSSRSSNTFTAKTRGYDGTSARSHLTAASVDHVLDAVSVQSMNDYSFNNALLLWMGV